MIFSCNLVNEDNIIIEIDSDRVDAALAPSLKSYGEEVIAKNPNKNVILDLSKVSLMDSSGLGVLVSLLKKMKGLGEIRIYGAQEVVKNIMHITRMDKVFKSFDDLDKALAA